jgi:hypothetical protein
MAREQSLTYRIQAKSDRLERDLALANKKLGRFKNQTRVNMDGIRNSFVGAFGGFIVLQAVTSAIKSLAGFELQMDKVAAISGATAKQMDELKTSALELGRTTIFTAGEIGKMQEELARLGFEPDRILASSEAISKLALVTSEELGEAAKTMAGTLNGFNLEAIESGRVANVMAESFAKSALTMEKFTVGTANSSAIARVFGASVEANTARLGKLVDANIDASKAGTDLRKIYIELNANGLTYDEGMQKIATSTDKIKTATELFGIRAAGAAVILSSLQGEVNELTLELSDSNMEIDHMAEVMSGNLSTDWKLFTSAIDGTIQKGGAATGVFRELVQAMTDMVTVVNHDSIPAWEKWLTVLGLSGGIKGLLEQAELTKGIKDQAAAQEKLANKTQATVEAFRLWHEGKKNGIKTLNALLKPVKQHVLLDEITIALKDLLTRKEKEHTASILKQADAYGLLLKASELASRSFEKVKTKRGDSREITGNESFVSPLGTSLTVGGDVESGAKEAFDKTIEDGKKALFDLQGRADVLKEKMVQMQVEAALNFTTLVIENGIINGIKAAFSQVLEAMGEGLIKLGIAAIAHSKIMEGIKASLAAGIGNPIVGAAAGAAAIAAGLALKASAAAINQNTSGAAGGGGGVSGPSGRFIGSGQNQQNKLEGEFTVRGSDLVYVINRQGGLDARQKAG